MSRTYVMYSNIPKKYCILKYLITFLLSWYVKAMFMAAVVVSWIHADVESCSCYILVRFRITFGIDAGGSFQNENNTSAVTIGGNALSDLIPLNKQHF